MSENSSPAFANYGARLEESAGKYPQRANAGQHLKALQSPVSLEIPLLGMLQGWLLYADAYALAYGRGVGQDDVLGKEWMAIGRALRDLLGGGTGSLDAGLLDEVIFATLEAEGADLR